MFYKNITNLIKKNLVVVVVAIIFFIIIAVYYFILKDYFVQHTPPISKVSTEFTAKNTASVSEAGAELTSFILEKIDYICPFYEPNGIIYRECLSSLESQQRKNFNGSAEEMKVIENYCDGVSDNYSSLEAGEIHRSCIIYKLNRRNPASFPKTLKLESPFDVSFTGEIFATMGSGSKYAIKSSEYNPKSFEFGAYYPNEDEAADLSGKVLVEGKLKYIDCEAYQTIFNGCTQWVEIEKIEAKK